MSIPLEEVGTPINMYGTPMSSVGLTMDQYGLGMPPSQVFQFNPATSAGDSSSPYAQFTPPYQSFSKGLRNMMKTR